MAIRVVTGEVGDTEVEVITSALAMEEDSVMEGEDMVEDMEVVAEDMVLVSRDSIEIIQVKCEITL